MRGRKSDGHRTILEAPLCSDETRRLAYDFIVRNGKAGRLQPIPGWKGDLADGYADILGVKPDAVHR